MNGREGTGSSLVFACHLYPPVGDEEGFVWKPGPPQVLSWTADGSTVPLLRIGASYTGRGPVVLLDIFTAWKGNEK